MGAEPISPAELGAALARRPAPGSVFATWEWLGPWLEHLGDDVRLFALDDALFGLARRHGGLRLIGDGLSDELGPIAADPRAGRPRARRRGPRLGEPLLARDLPGAHPWAEWLGGPVTHVEPCRFVEAPDFEAWLRSRPAFRRDARAVARRLEAAGAVIRDADDFDVLVRLHRLRFGAGSRVFEGANGAFLRDAFAGLAAAGRARLRVLEVGGEAVGALLLLRHHGADACYQRGFDPAAAHLRPGFTLRLDAVRRAPGGTLSLLRGDEAYKRAWATGDEPLVTVAVG